MPENNNWKPAWSDLNVPEVAEYCYPDSSFCITIEANGIIFVSKDDWLSKYSMAIHHDFDVKNKYLKYNADTHSADIIENIDLIYEGDILIHKPTYNFYCSAKSIPNPNPNHIPIDEDKFHVIQRNKIGDVATDPWNIPSNIEVLAGIVEIVSSAPVAFAIATGAGIIGTCFVLPALSIGAVNRAKETYQYAERFYANIFATVEFAFDDCSDSNWQYSSIFSTYDPGINEPCGVKSHYKQYIPKLPFDLSELPHTELCKSNSTQRDAKLSIANPSFWNSIYPNMDDVTLDHLQKDYWQGTFNDTIKQLLEIIGNDPSNQHYRIMKLRKFYYKDKNGNVMDRRIDNKLEYFSTLFAIKYISEKNSNGWQRVFAPSILRPKYELYRTAYKDN